MTKYLVQWWNYGQWDKHMPFRSERREYYPFMFMEQDIELALQTTREQSSLYSVPFRIWDMYDEKALPFIYINGEQYVKI